MTTESKIASHNDYVMQERNRLEGEVRKAIAILGFRRVMELCSHHADARSMEAADYEMRRRWKSVWRSVEKAVSLMAVK